MTVRKMLIVRAPGTDRNPMLRISNSFLLLAGFKVGTAIEVSYQPGLITIKKISNHDYHSTKVSAPKPRTSPAAPGVPAAAPAQRMVESSLIQ